MTTPKQKSTGPLLRRLLSACMGGAIPDGGGSRRIAEAREARVRATTYIEDLALLDEGTLCDAVDAYREGSLDLADLFALGLVHVKENR